MDYIHIKGGNPLSGTIPISGAKNSALKLMVTSLLTCEPIILKNVPDLVDINTLAHVLGGLGTHISKTDITPYGYTMHLSTPKITSSTAPYELVKTMRASVLVLGGLLGRYGHAKVSLPGGCAIGARPVDLHIKVMQALGAEINIQDGYIIAQTKNGLYGTEYEFPSVSVGATENAVLASVLAQGTSTFYRCAKEPEIGDLANCLNSMGAKISGAGTNVITVDGVAQLHGTAHTVLADRIEAGSFACLAGISGGTLTLQNVSADILQAPIQKLQQIGIHITSDTTGISCTGSDLLGCDITTGVYPNFPTDLQAQFMAMLTVAKGTSVIKETIFENRFMHVNELMRLGANITLNGNTATITGVDTLRGAEVMATDLRASVSLVIAGLGATGTTKISRIYHLDRGYTALEQKLYNIGADIQRIHAT